MNAVKQKCSGSQLCSNTKPGNTIEFGRINHLIIYDMRYRTMRTNRYIVNNSGCGLHTTNQISSTRCLILRLLISYVTYAERHS